MYQTTVENNHHDTSAGVHQEIGGTDRNDVGYHLTYQTEILFLEMQIVLRITKMRHHPDKSTKLSAGRCQSRSANAPIENENKQRRQKHIHYHRQESRHHRFARIAGCTHHRIESQEVMIEHIGNQYHLHKLFGIGQHLLAGAKKTQNGLQPNQSAHAYQQAHHHVQKESRSQHLLGLFVSFLAQTNGNERRRTHAQHRAESGGQIHDGHGDTQSGNRVGPYPVSDKNPIDNVIERRSNHSHDGRQSIFRQKRCHRLRPQSGTTRGIHLRFHICHHVCHYVCHDII